MSTKTLCFNCKRSDRWLQSNRNGDSFCACQLDIMQFEVVVKDKQVYSNLLEFLEDANKKFLSRGQLESIERLSTACGDSIIDTFLYGNRFLKREK